MVLAVITAFISMVLFLPGFVGADGPQGPLMGTLNEINDKLDQLIEGAAPVEKTGQITQYATGDDGNQERGVTWPNPRFTDNDDGTVKDNLTGLIWLKNANRFGELPWATALAACNNLADDGADLTDGSQAGDWQLTNIKELQSLIHYGIYDPALPDTSGTGQWTEGNPFSNVMSTAYWSSTTRANGPSYAWGMDFDPGGGVFNMHKTDSTGYVWCVRGGQSHDGF